MNPIDNDTLQAYVDGELDAESVALIEAALARDEILACRVQQAQALRAQLKSAFDPVLDEPVPTHLSALLQPPSVQAMKTAAPAATVMRRRGFGARRHAPPRRWLMPASAVAASLAVLAVALWWQPASHRAAVGNGPSFADSTLSKALNQSLASAPEPHATVTIGLTFRGADGRICRTFVDHAKPATAGLACHDDAGWSLPVVRAAGKSAGGELRQAASDMPADVQAAIDARMRGEAFNAAQERAARDAGWR